MGTVNFKKKGLGKLLGVADVLNFTALGPSAAWTQEDVVRLGDLLAISNAGVYIAIEKGYFKEQGIRNEVSTFASAAKVLPALTTGEMNVSVGSPSAGLFNAIAQGATFRSVADKGQNRAGTGFTMLSVRKDLLDAGQVKSVRDLKGRKVALFAKGISQHYLLGKMAEEVGLTINDFELVPLAGPNQLTAFETKAIDAAMTAEPWGARFEEQGVARRFRTADQVQNISPLQSAAIMYSGQFIKERRPVAQRWMNAYLKGCAFFATKGVQDAEVVAILEKHTKVPAKVIRAATPHYLDPQGRLNLENLADQIKWYVAHGLMPQEISVEKVVDLSFLR